MIGWLLDTNVTAEIISPGGSARVKAWAALQDETTLFLSILTVAEFDKGIAKLVESDPRRLGYMDARDRLILRFGSRLLSLTNGSVRRWGNISGRVRRDRGHAPPVIDTLLAATALEHNLYLASRNIRDVIHSGASVFNPWDNDPADFPLAARLRRRRSE